MASTTKDYDYISGKIKSLRGGYAFLREKPDAYVFSALCVKAHFYKNPALPLDDSELEEMIVYGSYDGGVDILLSDPSSESGDIVIGQSKFYKSIKHDDVFNALVKMSAFYKDVKSGHFGNVSDRTRGRFLTLEAETGSDARVIFVFFTSAPKNKISVQDLEQKFMELFPGTPNVELCVLFAADITADIREAESRRPTIESGEILIDREGNILTYGGEAAIVNVSAMSIKRLYAMHGNNFLARNLRYHIAASKSGTIVNVDKEIDATISTAPHLFWMKNSKDERNSYILEIAKAVNSQKPIRPADLKANSPEQVRFVQAMREAGVFYQTKRGETVPKDYKLAHKNTDISEIGKLCLCAVFQMPGTARNKRPVIYEPDYYDAIFCGDQAHTALIAGICSELLYIDHYFQTFLKNYEDRNSSSPMDRDMITFARYSRTLCVAFVAFASRYVQGNITEGIISCMKSAATSLPAFDRLRGLVVNLDRVKHIIPDNISSQDELNRRLDELFDAIISFGYTVYSIDKNNGQATTETNYLKYDASYCKIISLQWPLIKSKIREIFSPK